MDDSHPDVARLTGPDRRSWKPGLGAIVAVLAVGVVAGLVLLWPSGAPEADLSELGIAEEVYRATVVSVEEAGCSYAADLPCRVVGFELEEGPDAGGIFSQEFEAELPSSPRFEVGEAVVLYSIPDAPEEFQYQFADRDRRPVLVGLTVVFVVAVVALGGWRGGMALLGLAASLAIIIWFIVPAILDGRDPVLVAVVGAAAIGLLALYLAHGVHPLTHVAVIGTFAALALTAALSQVMLSLARFSGLASEESIYLTLVGDFDLSGLLLAGIVLGALGALDDVTVTQSSAVWELRRANPSISTRELVAAGLRVGRDHIASTVNTLLLAYAGASLPLVLLFALSRQSLGIVANSEVVAVEIVRTLVGSIGLVTAVPITTWLAARVAASGVRSRRSGAHAH